MNDRFKVRAWITAKKRMIDCAEVSPFHVGDCDRYRWNHDEVVLMQCTGIPDKNGRLIYEGDIYTIYGQRCVMEFKTESVTQYGHGDSSTTTYCGFSVGSYGRKKDMFSECKVIGNRYENPELMEGN